jgi:hypothetical protein
MIIVYGLGDYVSVNTAFGHAAVALAGLGPKSIYISWIRRGKSPALQRYKRGIFGEPVYRVRIPTDEDNRPFRIGISETAAYEWFTRALVDEAAAKVATGAFTPSSDFPLPYGPVYDDYSCVDVVKRILTASGAYRLLKVRSPTLTIKGLCCDALAIRNAALAVSGNSNQEWSSGQPVDFFADDPYRGRDRNPWFGSLSIGNRTVARLAATDS